ncbi:MAG: sugar ABC transporter permease [Firmicutes bacterium]|nr:sugar ABC transporter permease [Bacillota bacterium]
MKRISPYAFLMPALSILLLFFFFPSIYNFKLSFTDISLLDIRRGGRFIGLENYWQVLKDPNIHLAFKNTLLWLTGATVLIRILIGIPLALLLNSAALKRWQVAGIARALVLIPWATPPIVAVAAWKWLLDQQYGILNLILKHIGILDSGIAFFSDTSTVWACIIAIVVWNQVPFVVITLLAALQSIPEELYEAARVDGAGPITIYWYITQPLLYPALAIITLLNVIWTFNNFVYVWLSTRGGPGNFTNVLGTSVYLEAFTSYHLGYSATIGICMTLILLIMAVIYFRTTFTRSVMSR